MAITKNRDIVRLEIGDTDVDNHLFTDDELDVFLRRYGLTGNAADGTFPTLLTVAADACGALANRFARQFDFSEDGQSFSLGQRSALYTARQVELRRRIGGVISVPIRSQTMIAGTTVVIPSDP